MHKNMKVSLVKIYPWSLFLCLGVGNLAFSHASIAQAQTQERADRKRLSFTLSPQPQDTFDSLMLQAKQIIERTATQVFTENPTVTQAYLEVLGDRNGQVVPLLTANLLRSNWQKKTGIQPWLKYFGSAEVLLGYAGSQPTLGAQASPPTRITSNVAAPAQTSTPSSDPVPIVESPVARDQAAASHQEPNFY